MDHRRRLFLQSTAAIAAALGLPRFSPAATAAPDLAKIDGVAQALLVDRKELTATELTEAAIARIETVNPRLNAVIHKSYDKARERARSPFPVSPFAGVPFLVKDIAPFEGLPISYGSRAIKKTGFVPREDYAFQKRLRKAGLVVCGLSNTPEFGIMDTTEPQAFGPTANPWNVAYSAGGSSGGAASAVASGMVPFAHSTGGIRSTCIPASCCGVFSLKPSRNRTLHAKSVPNLPILESLSDSCVSRTVRDSAMFLAMTEQRGEAPLAPTGWVHSPAKRRLKIGFLLEAHVGMPSPEVRTAIEATAKLCASLGHTVEPARLTFGPEVTAAFWQVWEKLLSELLKHVSELLGKSPGPEGFEPLTLELAARGKALSADELDKAVRTLQQAGRVVDALFDGYDVLLSPVLGGPPIKLGEHDTRQPMDQLWPKMLSHSSYTEIFDITGGPAMSVPLGWSADDLPIGSHFGARRGDERTLLQLAYELEAAQPWAQRYPAIFAGDVGQPSLKG